MWFASLSDSIVKMIISVLICFVNDAFIDKPICVKMYDIAKMIYEKLLQKWFHKTSLSLLDLRFKSVFQDRRFMTSREEG